MDIIPADIGFMILGLSLKATGFTDLVTMGELMINISILLLGVIGYGLVAKAAKI
ncbi:MAG: hypothetical protein Q7V05_02880 [Methanoregula sp.]|nr:hypothetical protein [Methanoregula sp.]